MTVIAIPQVLTQPRVFRRGEKIGDRVVDTRFELLGQSPGCGTWRTQIEGDIELRVLRLQDVKIQRWNDRVVNRAVIEAGEQVFR